MEVFGGSVNVWIAPSAGRVTVRRSREPRCLACVARSRNGIFIRFPDRGIAGARPRRPSIAAGSTRDMRVTLMGSGRDHSTHIYYVIILIA